MSDIGRRFRQTLSFSNSRLEILLVMLEPWGEDYWLLPSEKFYVKVTSINGDFWYHVDNNPEVISIYVDGDFEDVSVMQNDERLECGHNRPKGAFS